MLTSLRNHVRLPGSSHPLPVFDFVLQLGQPTYAVLVCSGSCTADDCNNAAEDTLLDARAYAIAQPRGRGLLSDAFGLGSLRPAVLQINRVIANRNSTILSQQFTQCRHGSDKAKTIEDENKQKSCQNQRLCTRRSKNNLLNTRMIPPCMPIYQNDRLTTRVFQLYSVGNIVSYSFQRAFRILPFDFQAGLNNELSSSTSCALEIALHWPCH